MSMNADSFIGTVGSGRGMLSLYIIWDCAGWALRIKRQETASRLTLVNTAVFPENLLKCPIEEIITLSKPQW